MSPDPLPAAVIGLDLSLRSTGIAHVDGTTTTYSPTADGTEHYGIARLVDIRDHIRDVINRERDVELVMVEALAFDAHDSKREQAQLAGIVRCLLYDLGVPFLLVAPGTLKLYAAGNGKAPKLEMVRAAEKRLDYTGASDNEADALWLRAIGCELLGVPLCWMPDAHRKALRKLADTVPVRRS